MSGEQATNAIIARNSALDQLKLTEFARRRTAGTFDQFLSSGVTPGFLDLPSQVAPTAQLASLSNPGIMANQAMVDRQLINQGARGGQLNQLRAQAAIQSGLQRANVLQGFQHDDILRQEARDVDRARLRQSLFGGATDYATGGMTQFQQGLNQSMAGFGGAAQNLNSLGSQYIMQNMQTQQALGSLAGKGLGYAGGQMLPAYGQGSLGAQKSGAGAKPTGGVR